MTWAELLRKQWEERRQLLQDTAHIGSEELAAMWNASGSTIRTARTTYGVKGPPVGRHITEEQRQLRIKLRKQRLPMKTISKYTGANVKALEAWYARNGL